MTAGALTADDLQRTEARLVVHIQEANARIVTLDRHVGAIGERVDLVDRRCDVLSERIGSKFERVDMTLELLRGQIAAIQAALTPPEAGG